MEKIVFKKTGPISGFVDWIERFKGEISKDSLIIEIDNVKRLFISKTYDKVRSLVRYSEISFEDAGLEPQAVSDELKSSGERVLVGIFIILPKFIDALKTFETSPTFSMEIDYEKVPVQNVPTFCACAVQFKSQSLKMRIPGSSLAATEMAPMTDETFCEKVWVAPDPVSVVVSGDVLKNIVSVSEIFASREDKLSNYMEFYTDRDEEGNRLVKVRDPEQGSYDYVLGPAAGQPEFADFRISIYRERFLCAVRNAFAETTLIFSSSNTNRVLIQLEDGATKTIISRVRRDKEVMD